MATELTEVDEIIKPESIENCVKRFKFSLRNSKQHPVLRETMEGLTKEIWKGKAKVIGKLGDGQVMEALGKECFKREWIAMSDAIKRLHEIRKVVH